MRKLLTIGELATMLQTSTSSIRYYEKMGLISPTEIDSNGYRLFDIGGLDKMETILVLRDIDVPINKMKSVLSGYEIDDYLEMLDHSLLSLDQEIRRLKTKRNYLRHKMQSAIHLKEFGDTYQVLEMEARQYRRIYRGNFYNYTIKEIYDILQSRNIQWMDTKDEYHIISEDYETFQLCTKESMNRNVSLEEEVLLMPAGYYLTYGCLIEITDDLLHSIKKQFQLFKEHIRRQGITMLGSPLSMENLHCSEFYMNKIYVEFQCLIENRE